MARVFLFISFMLLDCAKTKNQKPKTKNQKTKTKTKTKDRVSARFFYVLNLANIFALLELKIYSVFTACKRIFLG
jgi:hypothetical protein